MGATVVSGGLSSANWTRSKPADYRGQDSEKSVYKKAGSVTESIGGAAGTP
jgi:hypothetical protein